MTGWLRCCFSPAKEDSAGGLVVPHNCLRNSDEVWQKHDGTPRAEQVTKETKGLSSTVQRESSTISRPGAWAAGMCSGRLRLSEDRTSMASGATTPSSFVPLAFYGFERGFAHGDGSSYGDSVRGQDAAPSSSTPRPAQRKRGGSCDLEAAGIGGTSSLPACQPLHCRDTAEFVELCGSLEGLAHIGEGSNGIVYSALWHGARVAVKFLLGSADDSAHLQRCLTEAVLTRVLSHPCVVQCFATAIAQMEPEVGEAIRVRCNRQQLLKSPSLDGAQAAQQAAAQDTGTALSTADISGVQQFMIGGGSTVGARDSFYAADKSIGLRSVCMSPEGLGSSLLGVGKDDETAMLELRKMENFFVDESPSASLGAQANLEGVSIQQALQDLQAEPGRHCTVVIMEYMDAGTLHQAIMRGDFSARRAVEYRSKLLALLTTAQEVAQGMAHLHNLDILHGDLKPTNVLLKGTPYQYAAPAGPPGSPGLQAPPDCRGYSAKIADLGLARQVVGSAAAQLPSDQWGALAYLAPEAAKGTAGKASDVYSFGVMLWEMAAGVRPYLGLTTPQVLMGLVTGTLQLTWPADGSIYAPLRCLGVACTDPNPAERPSFDMAARILARMLRHMRSATEPLRQRHSSALSMEMAHGRPTGGSSTACGSPSGCSRQHLNHAARSLQMCAPGSHTPVGCGQGQVPLGAVSPAALTQQLGAVVATRAAAAAAGAGCGSSNGPSPAATSAAANLALRRAQVLCGPMGGANGQGTRLGTMAQGQGQAQGALEHCAYPLARTRLSNTTGGYHRPGCPAPPPRPTATVSFRLPAEVEAGKGVRGGQQGGGVGLQRGAQVVEEDEVTKLDFGALMGTGTSSPGSKSLPAHTHVA